MTAKIIDGKAIGEKIRAEVTVEVQKRLNEWQEQTRVGNSPGG